MTMTELITAATLLLTATSTALRLNTTAAGALAVGEQRLQDTDRLDAELVLVERQLRDLSASIPAAAGNPVDACATRASSLSILLADLPLGPGLEREVELRPGPGALVAVEMRSVSANLARQRLFSLAAMGLCEAGDATP